ncbi:hypothetical protein G6F24_015971 [Rhizopus arrhizus]|nr:hypothetical protein G6F24_015971 [Rhizopus arrhizus]
MNTATHWFYEQNTDERSCHTVENAEFRAAETTRPGRSRVLLCPTGRASELSSGRSARYDGSWRDLPGCPNHPGWCSEQSDGSRRSRSDRPGDRRLRRSWSGSCTRRWRDAPTASGCKRRYPSSRCDRQLQRADPGNASGSRWLRSGSPRRPDAGSTCRSRS